MFKNLGGIVVLAVVCVAARAQMPVAQLPLTHINTSYSAPTGGTTWAAHTAAQLTSALKLSQPGDIIVLDAGTIYSGNFVVPAKSNPNKKWIYVTSSAYRKLPVPGTRVSLANAVNMPKIVTPNVSQALRFADAASYWRFVGVEIYSASTYHQSGYTAGVNYGYALVDNACYPNFGGSCPKIPNLPSNITYDRVYVHGDATHDVQAGISGNQISVAVVDSYISDIHVKGQDSQAFNAYMTPGPIKLVNNHLEAAGENVIFGGASDGPVGWIPSDIEIRNNYFFKPLAWVPLSLNGTYVVKNSLEFKNSQRVLVDRNTLENSWAAGQTGAALLFTPRMSHGTACAVKDMTVTNNILKNVVRGFDTLSEDSLGVNPDQTPETDNWVIVNNLVTLWDNTQPGNGAHSGGIIASDGTNGPGGALYQTQNFLFQHNTIVPFGSQTAWASVYFSTPNVAPYSHLPPWPGAVPFNNVWVLDNVFPRQITGSWSMVGMNALNDYLPMPNTPPNDITSRFYGNVMFAPVGNKVQLFPPHNYATTVPLAYLNQSIGDYQLSSPYWTDTSDGQIAGVNFAKLPTSTGSNVALYPSSR